MLHKLYVLGFAFSPQKDKVALIKKTKPQWQAGLLNGIGGKIEEYDDSVHHAMVREFEEETGYKTEPKDWKQSLIMEGNDWIVNVFHTTIDDLTQLKTTTEEEVIIFDIDNLTGNRDKLISNIPWLVSLHLDNDFNNKIHVEVDYF